MTTYNFSAQLTKGQHYEDTLDALISAWVGIECLVGRGDAFGDSTAAIWCPRVTR